jgi:hypothetical protein
LGGNVREGDYLKDTIVEGMTIIKSISKKLYDKARTALIGFEIIKGGALVVNSAVNISVFIKCGEFLDWLTKY